GLPASMLSAKLAVEPGDPPGTGTPGKPGCALSCHPALAAPWRIIGTTTGLIPFAMQLGSAPGGLQKYPGSSFWFPVVKKKVMLLRSKNIPNPERMTVLLSG